MSPPAVPAQSGPSPIVGSVRRSPAAAPLVLARGAGVVADRAPGAAGVGGVAGDGGRVGGRSSRARARWQGREIAGARSRRGKYPRRRSDRARLGRGGTLLPPAGGF